MIKHSALVALQLLAACELLAQSATPRWGLSEEMRIGSVDGPEAFSTVLDLTTSPDGVMLYVAQRADRSIWLFDAESGEFKGKIGRGGEGPGEFRSLLFLGWKADTLYATDTDLTRVTLFNGVGEHVRTIVHVPVMLPQTRGITYPTALLPNGLLLVQSRLATKSLATGEVVSAPLLIADEDEVLDTIATRNLRGTIEAAPVGRITAFVRQPMSERNLIGVDELGRYVVVVAQPAGTDAPGTFQILKRGFDGRVLYRRAYNYQPVAVSRKIADSLIAYTAAGYERYVAPARALNAARSHLHVPEFHPPITDMLVGRDGTVWLRLEDTGAESVNYVILGSEGRIVAYTRAPAGLKLLHADGDRLWGTIRDELDVPYVVRYRVSK